MDVLKHVKEFAFSWKMGILLATVLVLALVFFMKKRSKVEAFEEEEKMCEVFFFYTTWCPYCKKARKEWDKFKATLQNTSRDDYKFVFTEVDCDQNEAMATKYNVVGYPTIKLLKDGKITEYDAKTSESTLHAFVDSCF
jgi:thiol-disulfide isomerase/thioredoxin